MKLLLFLLYSNFQETTFKHYAMEIINNFTPHCSPPTPQKYPPSRRTALAVFWCGY